MPPTERNGRVQSSTITVAVLPDVVGTVEYNGNDFEYSAYRAGGPGGQNRNKVETAVECRHKPSGLVVRCASERSQYQNKANALRLMLARLANRNLVTYKSSVDAQRRKQVGSGERSDKRRTVRVKDKTVEDHIDGRTWRYDEYVKGDW